MAIMDLNAEQMLAVSVGVKDDTVCAGDAWSNHKAWSAESFMPQDEETVEE